MNRVRLLLVDDDPEIRLLAGVVLGAAGYDVLQADSGSEAAERLAESGIDVLLMDVMLGEEDGVSVAARLLEGRGAVKLVFLTGATRGEHRRRMTAARPAGILPKPFDPTTLAADLRRILDDDVP